MAGWENGRATRMNGVVVIEWNGMGTKERPDRPDRLGWTRGLRRGAESREGDAVPRASAS